MVCDTCRNWTAKTPNHLFTRRWNYTVHGGKRGPKPYPCDKCGGTDWMLTNESLQPNRYGLMKYAWFRKLRADLVVWKLKKERDKFISHLDNEQEIARVNKTLNSFIEETRKEIMQ